MKRAAPWPLSVKFVDNSIMIPNHQNVLGATLQWKNQFIQITKSDLIGLVHTQGFLLQLWCSTCFQLLIMFEFCGVTPFKLVHLNKNFILVPYYFWLYKRICLVLFIQFHNVCCTSVLFTTLLWLLCISHVWPLNYLWDDCKNCPTINNFNHMNT